MRYARRAKRSVGILLAALFTIVTGEPLRMHVCIMHDSPELVALFNSAHANSAQHAGQDVAPTPANHATHQGAHDTPQSHAHVVIGTPDANSASQQASQQGSDNHAPGSHSCQCAGTCCVSAPTAAPSSKLVLTLNISLTDVAVVAPAVPVAVPGSADVVLPFAIGPPNTPGHRVMTLVA